MMRKPYLFLEPSDDPPPSGRSVRIVDAKGRAQLVLSWNDERTTGERDWLVHDPPRSQRQRRFISRLTPDTDGLVRVSRRYRPRHRARITRVGDYLRIELDGLTVRHYVLLAALEKRAHSAGDTLTLTIDELRDCISS